MPRSDRNPEQAAEYDNGNATGQRWVTKKGAPQEELARLDQFRSSLEDTVDWGRWFSDEPNDAYSTAERLYFVLTPDHDGDRDEAQSFWEFVVRARDMADITASFVEGFVEGALEAWDQTKTTV
jgi:hypothetical protein